MFALGVSPARKISEELPYPTWGHSTVVSPWGDVLGSLDENEGKAKFSLYS